jgi:hypothetical protein
LEGLPLGCDINAKYYEFSSKLARKIPGEELVLMGKLFMKHPACCSLLVVTSGITPDGSLLVQHSTEDLKHHLKFWRIFLEL